MDWFVSAALARDGRMNGYLSAVQDGVLTGYGAVAAPEVARDGAEAMIRALDEMTLVTPATRAWFVETHGRGRSVPVAELTRRVLEVPLTGADRRLEPAREIRRRDRRADGRGQRARAHRVRLRLRREALGSSARSSSGRACSSRRPTPARAGCSRAALATPRRPTARRGRCRALLGNAWTPGFAERAQSDLRDAILRRAVAAARASWRRRHRRRRAVRLSLGTAPAPPPGSSAADHDRPGRKRECRSFPPRTVEGSRDSRPDSCSRTSGSRRSTRSTTVSKLSADSP